MADIEIVEQIRLRLGAEALLQRVQLLRRPETTPRSSALEA